MKQNEVYEVRPSPTAAVNDTTEKVALQDNPGYGVTPANPIQLQDNPGYGVTPANPIELQDNPGYGVAPTNPIELQDNPGYGVNSAQSHLHGKTLDNEYDYNLEHMSRYSVTTCIIIIHVHTYIYYVQICQLHTYYGINYHSLEKLYTDL